MKGEDMELLSLAAIIAGLIAAVIGIIIIIKKIAAFYKQKFNFSIWSGVLLIVLALSLTLITGTTNLSVQATYILIAFAAIFTILTIYNDIRLAGCGWGILAIALQLLFAFFFIFLILFLVIAYVAKKIYNIQNSLLNSVLSTGFGIKSDRISLLQFLRC